MRKPLPITIIVDTREQAPLEFWGEHVTVERATLPEGDYSARGLEGFAAIERKSISDLIGSLTHDRERFKRELERLRTYAFRTLVVEGPMADIAAGAYRSRALPQSILGSVAALSVDFGLPVLFCDDRRTAAFMVEKLLRRVLARRGEVPSW